MSQVTVKKNLRTHIAEGRLFNYMISCRIGRYFKYSYLKYFSKVQSSSGHLAAAMSIVGYPVLVECKDIEPVMQIRHTMTMWEFLLDLAQAKRLEEEDQAKEKGIRGFSKMVDTRKEVEDFIKNHKIAIFSKSYCPYCNKVKDLFKGLHEPFGAWEVDLLVDGGARVQEVLLEKTGQKTVPNVFINNVHVGGCDSTFAKHESGELKEMLLGVHYDFDLIVLGGGSGGLAASKEAASLGMRVCVCDFVVPTPKGTSWGLGGTCVNVGCIPKKLMHKAALLGEEMKKDARSFGWNVPETVGHQWSTMVEEIKTYIKSLNFGYRKALREKGITYKNAFATFIDEHTVEVADKKGKVEPLSARHFIIACGGRPNYPDIPGAKEYGITSDDLFTLEHHPGNTLIVGASYIALECAGFLNSLGSQTTVMVRSILLRGFDQQMAELVGAHMSSHGVRFLKQCVPTMIEEVQPGSPGQYKVTGQYENGEVFCGVFNTVLFAIGRTATTEQMNVRAIGVELNEKNKKVKVDPKECTTVDNIFAIGDVIDGKLELTPVAIQAGKLLARRLYSDSDKLTDYVNVPTTVFTPLEYGFVGMSEEEALEKCGEENVEVYHTKFTPLEWALSKRDENSCYAKLVCMTNKDFRKENAVVGFHYLGPNAGEVTQGFALGVKMFVTKEDFEDLIGIHPTCAEVFTTLSITKRSGKSVATTGC